MTASNPGPSPPAHATKMTAQSDGLCVQQSHDQFGSSNRNRDRQDGDRVARNRGRRRQPFSEIRFCHSACSSRRRCAAGFTEKRELPSYHRRPRLEQFDQIRQFYCTSSAPECRSEGAGVVQNTAQIGKNRTKRRNLVHGILTAGTSWSLVAISYSRRGISPSRAIQTNFNLTQTNLCLIEPPVGPGLALGRAANPRFPLSRGITRLPRRTACRCLFPPPPQRRAEAVRLFVMRPEGAARRISRFRGSVASH